MRTNLMRSRKGDFVWSNLGSLILVILLLVILLVIFYFLKDKIVLLWKGIRDFIRFGGG